MWLSTFHIEEAMNDISRYLDNKGVDYYILNGFKVIRHQVRFSNSKLDIVRFHDSSKIDIVIGMKGRRIVSSIYQLDPLKYKGEIDRLLSTIDHMPKTPLYSNLPSEKYNYTAIPGIYKEFDIDEITSSISEVIDMGKRNRVDDVNGAILYTLLKHVLKASNGCEGEFRRSNLNVNIRFFKGRGSTVVNAESTIFNSEQLIKDSSEAITLLKKGKRIRTVKPGKYRIILSPVVVGNLLNYFSRCLSAYSIITNTSPLVGKIGEEIISENLSISDYPLESGNPGARPFDLEGSPTKNIDLINRGVLESYLHNLSTAKYFGVKTTGHAGIVFPQPHSIMLRYGDTCSLDELLVDVKDGLYIINAWYTRFQNYATGDFSTIQRDTGFIVKNGELSEAVTGARINGNIITIFKNIINVANDDRWVKWWDYPIPSRVPHIAFEGIQITTGF